MKKPKEAPSSSPLSGVEFVEDSDPRTLDPRSQQPEGHTTERATLTHTTARRVAEFQKFERKELPRIEVKFESLSPEEAARKRPKMFLVKSPGRIFKGGASYELRPGKVVSELHYDIDGLRKQGVQLEEI